MSAQKFVDIQKGIIGLIISRCLDVNDQLPTEKELAKTFGSSVMTVRKALNALESTGMVSREQGRGTFVNSPIDSAREQGVIGFLQIRSETPDAAALETSTDVAGVGIRGFAVKTIVAPPIPTGRLLKELKGLSGILVTGWLNKEWLAVIKGMDIPVVVIGDTLFPVAPVHSIVYDWRGMALMLGRRMIDRGAKSIKLITSGDGYAPSLSMREGFKYLQNKYSNGYLSKDVFFANSERRAHDVWEYLDVIGEFDGILVEIGYYDVVLGYCYERGIRPMIGVMAQNIPNSAHPKNVEVGVFPESIFPLAAEMLFAVKNSDSKAVKRVKLECELLIDN